LRLKVMVCPSVASIDPDNCLKLDTEVMSADLNAQEIVRRFGLGAMQNS
jgi:hypothetical protein